MKRLITLVSLVLFALILSAQPKMVFTTTEHDFGTIKEDKGLATTVFEFKNDGDQPLILNNVKATCGCTTPEWTQEPVAPGKTGSIKVSYNPQNRPGDFTKNVNVFSNSSPTIVVLTIKGTVEQRQLTLEEQYPREMGGLRWKSNYLSLGSMTNTEEKTEVLEFYNSSEKEISMGVYRTPDYITVTFEPEKIASAKFGKMTVKYNAKNRNAYGYVSDRIYLNIDGKNDNNFSVGVSVTINEDFSKLTADEKAKAPVASFDNNVYDFGSIKEGEIAKHDFKLTNNGKSDLLIRNVKASCGCTAVKNENVVKPGQTTDLKVEFNSRGKKGRQNKSVTVITNDPSNSTMVLRIMGDVNAQ
ncbi:MAG TPA: DUF1573 domain-containing protein [Prolixibacteraceae bacterium]|nr:DUF1573 domain-containing protein [Prolixibacteraceae bacterium]HPS12339.1 DUF1573 domain-containing protein [Prolixibacteraceae bacterium]